LDSIQIIADDAYSVLSLKNNFLT